MSTQVVSLSAAALKGLLKVVSTDSVRYYMTGIFVDTAHERLVATNGGMLLVAKLAFLNTSVAPFIVSSDQIKAVLKGAKARETITISRTETGVELVGSNNIPVCGLPVDGRYPQYESVLPRTPTGEPAVCDPALVAVVRDGLMALGVQGVRMVPSGSGAAVLFGEGRVCAVGVVMPLRPVAQANAVVLEAAAKAIAAVLS